MKSLVLLSIVCVLFVACNNQSKTSSDASGLPIPPKDFVANAINGKALYQQHCQLCHGKEAKGSRQGPPLIHKIYEPNHHADLSFYMAVNRGVQSHHWKFGNMPAIPGVNPKQAAHIIRYIRQEQKAAGIF
ncbi:MAG: cytochrome c [Gammaproteobacteria bacterium]|nr:cytochrome c [Gammaproteobacteria bacterium]